jgi:hypothetical protein
MDNASGLAEDASAYGYEFAMLIASSYRYHDLYTMGHELSAEERELGNALLESFLLHARNLIDFFFPRPSRRPTDICATDFVGRWTNTSAARTRLESERYEIDRRLSHLTRHRHSEHQYLPVRIAGDLVVMNQEFLEAVLAEAPQLDQAFDRPLTMCLIFLSDFGDFYRQLVQTN